MTDIVERLRSDPHRVSTGLVLEAADEIDRLREMTSNPRYWEARYRDEAAEVDRMREELDTWQSVFPDIAPEHVQPDRSLLEKEIAGLRAALRSVIEAWDNEYDGEMAVDRAIGEARELLPQTGDEG